MEKMWLAPRSPSSISGFRRLGQSGCDLGTIHANKLRRITVIAKDDKNDIA
jgi:hypothetical protein